MVYTKPVFILAKNSIKEIVRKKDFYVLLILLFAFILWLTNLSFFQEKEITRYLKEASLQIIWIFSLVIAIPTAARQIPSELSNRTIYPLLAKPITRFQFVLGKFFGAGLASIFSFTTFYLTFLLFLWLKKGQVSFIISFQTYYLQCLFLLFITSLVLFLSVFLTSAANITLSFLLYYFVLYFVNQLKVLSQSSVYLKAWIFKLLYFILPHFEFFDLKLRLVHDWPVIPLWAVFAVTGYAFFYIWAFIILTWISFRRKVL